MGGYFATIGGKILDSGRKVGSLGLGHMAEVVFHWRLLGGSFGGVVKVVAFKGLGSELAVIVARLIVGVHGTAAAGVGFLGTLMVIAWCKGFCGVGLGKGVGLQGQGVGAGMSGVRLVGALGRDQTYVSAGNPTHRRGNGRRGNGREEPVPGARVGNG